MAPIELEIQSDSEVESIADGSYDDDSSVEEDQYGAQKKEEETNQQAKDLASGDSKNVRTWKILVLFIMATLACCISAGAYYFLEKEENDEYLESYALFSNTIKDTINIHAENIEQGFRAMSQVISSDAKTRLSLFPFYALANFEVVAAAAKKQSRVKLVTYSPIITADDIPNWLGYTASTQGWMTTSWETMVARGEAEAPVPDFGPVSPYLYNVHKNGTLYAVDSSQGSDMDLFAPLWQLSPPPLNGAAINMDLFQFNYVASGFALLNATREAQLSRILRPEELMSVPGLSLKEEEEENYLQNRTEWRDEPHSVYLIPILENTYDNSSRLVGFLSAFFAWDQLMVELLPEGVRGIVCVVRNSCGQAITYELLGHEARYLGPGNRHDTRFEHTEVVVPFYNGAQSVLDRRPDECRYDFVLYASETFEQSYRSDLPIVITLVVGGAFLILIGAFFVYDSFVQRRNRKVVAVAAKTNEIVASLFPQAVRERLFEEAEEAAKKPTGTNENEDSLIKKFLSGNEEMDKEVDEEEFMYKTRPIADLYPETTILFADIAGFTAWSSVREPAQVFTLLETFYKAFDDIAGRKGIFKVETIGDCYVAVAGLPEPRPDHAVVMCRFASECMERMNFLAKKLEVHLGPDTTELEMRAGLHSGAVTAGVLRGVRSRFQLFGDTMNTASRMESTGLAGKIQVSQETADLLVKAGKMSWITPREERIMAKGKGELQTYFVNVGPTIDISGFQDGSIGGSLSDEDGPFAALSPKTTRLVLWNVEILLDLLRQIKIRRGKDPPPLRETVVRSKESTKTAYEELQSVIQFPPYTGESAEIDTENVDIGPEVEAQLEAFLSTIAGMYLENHFHDFAHASHATMGVVKLLSSLTKPRQHGESEVSANASYVIATNPLVQFAIVLSVICHDVDHPGVPNAVLLKEKALMASVYGNKSVAEQNSLDLTWDLLMDDSYSDLRAAIYRTDEEKKLFRQILVNCVICTDLFDAAANSRFNSRWKAGFPDGPAREQAHTINLQATLIMETMIQAADIAHCMQHWQVYRKWNVRLFEELYQGFVDGRSTEDPSSGWYKGEMEFYDNYVLPLVRRMQSSGAFVASSTDSHVDYAEQNRSQWEEKGRDIVAEMVDATRTKIVARGQVAPLDLSQESERMSL